MKRIEAVLSCLSWNNIKEKKEILHQRMTNDGNCVYVLCSGATLRRLVLWSESVETGSSKVLLDCNDEIIYTFHTTQLYSF